MATIRPFRALRPPADRAAAVSAVPYDVVSTAEARDLARGNPWSFLHVSRAEIDLSDGTDAYADAVYRKAAENFERLKREAPLSREDTPLLYAYRQSQRDHEQTGLAGSFSLDEYDTDVIRKHEKTRRDKEDDRTRHMVTLRAQTGPVLLTYRDRAGIDELIADAKKSDPLYDFTAADGVAHAVWRLSEETTRRLVETFRSVPLLYIADGHHRAASAGRARVELRGANPGHRGNEDYNFLLAVAFPAGQLRILPYNRVVTDLNDRSPREFLTALEAKFSVSQGAPPSPPRKGEVSVYLDRRWYGLTLPKPSGSNPIEALDAARLQRHVLDSMLGIRDVRTDKRIDFVGGVRGTDELGRRVDSGRAAAAFSLFPV
ncbi:MAG TPA: DUF1015 domain-containing protein, partial [Thermoanaerobaculia bacterium]|nr:DUF1015 domain-containing protein [Thermoanaerobaculia bacterium]